MKKNLTLVAVTLALIGSQAFAQMTKPEFGPELAKLGFLTGHFTTQTKLMMDPNSTEGSIGTGSATIHWGLDSMFVFINEEENSPAMGSYKGFGVLGYDLQQNQYVLSMYNNFADRPQYKGSFTGDTLTLTTNVETPNGPFTQQLKWYKEGNNVRLRIFNDMGQGFVLAVDQTATPASSENK